MEKVKREKLVAQRDWKFDPVKHARRPKGKSLTLPDESWTVRELLDKAMAGGSFPQAAPFGTYGDFEVDYDSQDLEKLRDMDLIDRQEFLAANKERIDALEAKLKLQESEAKALRDKEAAEEADFRKSFKEFRERVKKEESEKL